MVPFQKYPVEFKVCENIAPPKARMCQKAGNRWILISANIWSPHWSNQYNTHWIHVWYIYLHLHCKSTKRRWIYHTRILWDMECQSCHVRFLIVDLLFLISHLFCGSKKNTLRKLHFEADFWADGIPAHTLREVPTVEKSATEDSVAKMVAKKIPFKKGWSSISNRTHWMDP